MPDSVVPLSLDPREPPPRSSSRPPTRSLTPQHTSRPVSPHPPGHSPLPPVGGGGGHHAEYPPSPMSSSLSGHFSQQQGREEGEDSSIFERDVEAAVPVSLGTTTPATAAAVTAPPSPSASPLGRTTGQHHHLHSTSSPTASSHVHHPVTRASVTDRIFPTVLDDAVEALTSSAQGGGDVFVVSASQTPSRDHSPSRVFRREPREASSMGSSPQDARHRDRRESGVSLRGQADKLLHSQQQQQQQVDGGSAVGSPSPRSSPEPEGGAHHLHQSASLEGRLAQLASSPSHSPRLGRSPAQSPRLAPHVLSLPSNNSASSIPSPSPSSSAASPFGGSIGGGGPIPSPSAVPHSLSFVSPQDLITSPPLSTQSLSSITSGASLLPSVGSAPSEGGHDSWSVTSGSPAPAGQWERGGLGKGLEERLEELAVREKAAGRTISP